MGADIFCTPKIYETTFFETRQFLAVYNIRPVIRGHSLLIPKRHVVYLTELTSGEINGLKEIMAAVLPRWLKAFDSDSYNLSINAGEHAGMVVNHLHFHIVPRSDKDPLQGKLIEFYHMLNNDRGTWSKEVPKEVERLRKIFKYKPTQKRLSQ
ncbi:MAG: HIT family protein [Candidatus Micrarchaeota archaeon]|nr:HIT family protein [Candidatus Micrarchaeota archaeon]